MNNGESIKKYNDLLINYLNDLVNDIESTSENNMKFFEDIATRLVVELKKFSINIAEDGIKTLMMNAFKEYSNILKNHFDTSGIHRINDSSDVDKLINEMNEVNANLANAVTSMNKISEYLTLVNKIKISLIAYFKQVNSEYSNIENEINNILDNIIVSSLDDYAKQKIDDFSIYTLPELYVVTESVKKMTYEEEIAMANEKYIIDNANVVAERDAFISQTMDIEIKEGFENGVVTLVVIDSMGVENKYYGEEAMEKLASYNQLFESSRPGRKVDTSHWENSLPATQTNVSNSINNGDLLGNQNFGNDSITNPNDRINNGEANPLPNGNITAESNLDTNNNVGVVPLPHNNINVENNLGMNDVGRDINNSVGVSQLPTNNINEENNLGINDNANFNDFSNLSEIDNENNENADFIKSFLSNYGNENDINNSNNINNNISTNGDDNSNGEFNNLIEQQKSNNELLSLINPDSPKVDFTTLNTSPQPITPNNDFNNLSPTSTDTTEESDNTDLGEVRKIMGIENNSVVSDSLSFIPTFDNPNEDRNEFIKKTTGILIEEDTDNKGLLYLKVTEPTGREQIYTGKEAVSMIKNYNKIYLEANPDASVDTSLIEGFE